MRIMKLICVLLTAACLQLSARGLAQTITITGKDLPLENIFKEIKKQSGYVVFYNYDLVKDARPVSLSVKNGSVHQVMALVLKDQPLSYSIENKTIVITRKTKTTKADDDLSDADSPPIDIKGRVVNENGEPLEGVSIMVKNGSKAAISITNGEFNLFGIDPDAVLIFTSVNTERLEVKVQGRTQLTITLKNKVSSLGEVQVSVNTGYQYINKERYVGSFVQLDSATYHRRAGMDIISRLDGIAPGILFDKKSPNISDQMKKVQIRGYSTLQGMQESANLSPLVIVDNFPFRQDLSSLNPNDVESITVLRDAAATSIWGAQAGNGVIVITMKKGKYNQPLRVSVSSNISVYEKPDQYYVPAMTVNEFIDFETDVFNRGYYNPLIANTTTYPAISPVVEVLARRRAGLISAEDSAREIHGYRSTDLRKELDKWVYRNPVAQQYYLSLSGGSQLFSYSLSSGFNHSLNNIRGSEPAKSVTLNSTVGIRATDKLDIGVGINYSQTIDRSQDLFLGTTISPYAQLADAEGNPAAIPYIMSLGYTDTVGGGRLLDWKFRPLEELAAKEQRRTTKFLQLSLNANYNITKWLNARLSYQFSDQGLSWEDYKSEQTFEVRNLVNMFTNLNQTLPRLRNPVPVGDILDMSNVSSQSHNFRGQLNFNKTFGGDHSVNALAALEGSENAAKSSNTRFYGYDRETGSVASAIDYINAYPIYNNPGFSSTIPTTSAPGGSVQRFLAAIFNLSYTYKGRYILYGSARKDGSNVFGVNTNRRWKPLWSVGGSWDLSKEHFFNVRWVNSLRLKTSYGFSGNPSGAIGMPVISYSSFNSIYHPLPIAISLGMPNPNLRWEKVRIVNFAVEFSVLNNRLSGNVDVYSKRSTDVYWTNPPAPSTGAETFSSNAADLKGQGFEISLRSKNTVGAVQWQTGFNLSHAKTIVKKVFYDQPKASYYTAYGMNPAPGQIMYGLSSYRWAGLDPLTGAPRGYYQGHVSTNYNAILNDSLTNQVFHGSAIPLYFGNLTNSVSWKNLTLLVNISYRLDFYYRKPTIDYNRMAVQWTTHGDYSRRWQKPGDEAWTNVPAMYFPFDQERERFYMLSEANVARGDNLRLDEIRLQYSWAPKNPKKGIKSAQFSLAANRLNVILWKKDNSDYDPDFTGGTSFTNPSPAMLTGAISFNF